MDLKHTPLKSSVSTASGSRRYIVGFCFLPVFFKNVTKHLTFYLLPSLRQSVYFGVNFWRDFGLVAGINSSNFNCISQRKPEFKRKAFSRSLTGQKPILKKKTVLEFPSYEKLGLGTTDVLQHYIDTGNAVPVKCKHYPLSLPKQEVAY